jgi:hypothetical protein
MFNRSTHKVFQSAGWLALLGLLLQILLPIFHHPVLAQDTRAPMRMCAMGMKMVGNKVPKTPAKQVPSCPICQTLHQLHNSFVQPDEPVAVFTAVYVEPIIFSGQFYIIKPIIPLDARPRAPPILA